jgi:endonuclease/exonuclease/phosphatase family metal-dependent hydrolase
MMPLPKVERVTVTLKHRMPTFNVSWMRIDHIMMSSHFQSRDCWTGTGEASDHRPVIADLVLGQTK